MSTQEPRARVLRQPAPRPRRPGLRTRRPRPGGGPAPAAPVPEDTPRGDDHDASEEHDQPQNAWSARRDLVDHSPRTMNVGARARFGGGLLGGDQHGGISGGHFTGDVFMGGRTEIYHLGAAGTASPGPSADEVPRSTLERLDGSFVAADGVMADLLDRLRRDRVLVLSGARFTGRRTAALMLLHRLGAAPVRTLVPDTAPGALADGFTAEAEEKRDGDPARGYVLCDLATRRDRPLREPHLLAARDRLVEQDAYLVITVGPSAALEDVPAVRWEPPAAADVLATHLRARTDEESAAKLLGLPDVTEFLDRGHQLREVAAFARLLGRYAAGEVTEDAVARFSLVSLENQVQEWFEEDETSIHLRDKAFLVALAAFDGGPYALTAELSDLLYRFLQETENRARVPEVPVFGTHVGKRLQLARAHRYEEDEHTEWGPVTQRKAAFRDDRASLVLLREVWTGHPSARPALIAWLRARRRRAPPGPYPGRLHRRRPRPYRPALRDGPGHPTLGHVQAVPAPARRRQRAHPRAPRRYAQHPAHPRRLVHPRRSAAALGGGAGVRADRTRAAGTGARRAARRRPPPVHGRPRRPGRRDGARTRRGRGAVAPLPASDLVLTELLGRLDDDRAVHDLTLGGFVNACRRTEDDERYGTPLVLGWYARAATEGAAAAHGIPALWRAALADPRATRHALDVLREWVLIADRTPATEWALAALLPALVTTSAEHQRLSHLLRTMPGEDGAPPPLVAARLLTTLPAR
ncbi:hypothetical protein ACFQ51_24745 [Streptomyces kaempferi]